MMRNMSFSLTTPQMRDRTKTVTRRIGWDKLKPGDRVRACVKCMGMKKGEKVEVIGIIEVVSNRPETLNQMQDSDCALEGFPEMTAAQFVGMFSKNMKCDQDRQVNRIEFKHVD